MKARILAVVAEGGEAAALPGLAALAGVARAEDALVRLAYLHRIPPPRTDRHGRVAVDSDGEMARIAGVTGEALRLAARTFDDVEIETVVRFGAPRRELGLELDVFAPSLVAFFGARATGLRARWRAWRLRRPAARRAGLRVIVLETARPWPATPRLVPAIAPRWRGADTVREPR